MGRWQELRKSRAARWALDVTLIVLLVVAVGAWQSRNHIRGDAPRFAWRSLGGDLVTNDALRGKPTMLVFWAPWCGVCRAESSNVSLVQSLVGGRAHVVSVAAEYGSLAEVRGYVDALGVDYPVMLGGNAAAREWGVRAFPSVFFLDSEGRIDGSVVGYSTTIGLLARLLW